MKKVTDKNPSTPDFAEVINLLSILSDATSQLAAIEAEANTQLLDILDDAKKEYAQLQEAAKKAEAALEVICRAHPEWFENAKSIKTPYGKVLLHKSTSLEVTNEEATLRLLHAEERANPDFHAADYVRIKEEPNLEALELLSDQDLERFMIKRIIKDVFSATPAKIDFGKAVEKAIEKKEAA